MSWEQAWLNYKDQSCSFYDERLEAIYYSEKTASMEAARDELVRAIGDLTGTMPRAARLESGLAPSLKGLYLEQWDKADLGQEGYEIVDMGHRIVIGANTDRGILYGAFALIRKMMTGSSVEGVFHKSTPKNPLRMVNHWDNADGSIERGYSGSSFFFKDGKLLVNNRTKDYARLMASIGINGVVINNVNVAKEAIELITDRYFKDLKALEEVLSAYGIKLFLSLDYAAPIDIGNLSSADPLDEDVRKWWQDKMAQVYHELPNLGGFLIKADSEGRPGPFTYGRSHADGANMLAQAVKPYGGLIIWRCFVYNCQQDWRDKVTDRARAGYDHFKPLDGQFDDHVILQIKNGPMDFQVREPLSPLLGAMPRTNQILEVQIAQEYTGQQRHVCYLIPMFKEILAFRTYHTEEADAIRDLTSGKMYGNKHCGMATVINTGDDENWTGHDLAAANLFGYGRLTWDMDLEAEVIGDEWIRMTFGSHPLVLKNILEILMKSWPAYEAYTSPLGIGWMVNPNHHYGPNVDGYEYDRWGTYHRADHKGIGVDRSDKGTGYTSQYAKENYMIYNDPETCPDALILFFHHLPYDHLLKGGKTVLQHIYDTHFEGVLEVEAMVGLWEDLRGLISNKSFERTKQRFNHQLMHAKEWRDVVNTYFYRKTGIGDQYGRPIYE